MKPRSDLMQALSIPVLSLLFSLIYLVSTLSLPGISANYPRGIATVISFLSVWLIGSEVKRIKKQRPDPSKRPVSAEFKTMLLVEAAMLACIIAIPYLGYYLDSFLWMFLTSMIIDNKVGWKNRVHDLVISAIFVTLAYLVFKKLFLIPTPEGVWV
jgi:hypothetical protein